jgi:hypothetical protein
MPRRRGVSFGSLATGVPASPEPVGLEAMTALASYNIAEYGGGPGGGYVHYGMKGDPALTWSGLTATPQIFQGQAQMGKTTGVSVQEYPALPNDQAPPGIVSWLPDWTAGLMEQGG